MDTHHAMLNKTPKKASKKKVTITETQVEKCAMHTEESATSVLHQNASVFIKVPAGKSSGVTR